MLTLEASSILLELPCTTVSALFSYPVRLSLHPSRLALPSKLPAVRLTELFNTLSVSVVRLPDRVPGILTFCDQMTF